MTRRETSRADLDAVEDATFDALDALAAGDGTYPHEQMQAMFEVARKNWATTTWWHACLASVILESSGTRLPSATPVATVSFYTESDMAQVDAQDVPPDVRFMGQVTAATANRDWTTLDALVRAAIHGDQTGPTLALLKAAVAAYRGGIQ